MRLLLIFILFLFISLSVDLGRIERSQIQKETIEITVEGAVKNPGKYSVSPYSTVSEVMELAEPDESADLDRFNPSTILHDHDRILVPEKGDDFISINSGTLEELTSLPGIGLSTAQKIIQYREENGFFQSLDQLQEVSGIGEKKFEQIRGKIRL